MSLKIIALTRARVDRHVFLLKYKRMVGLYFNKHIRTSLFRANWVKFLHTSAYRKRYIQILCKHLWSIMAQRKSRSSSGITNTETSRPSHYEISGRLAVHVRDYWPVSLRDDVDWFHCCNNRRWHVVSLLVPSKKKNTILGLKQGKRI